MTTTVPHPACGEMTLVNTPVKFSGAEPSVRSAPPLLGQHTDEVLIDILGYGKETVRGLRQEGVVA